MEQDNEEQELPEHYCEVCDDEITPEQAYMFNGLCEDCWAEEQEAAAELDNRT
jgi:hypothetical protein